tara:strand:- start:591 stop:1175 length:585 start_codon:yes stop_codon:yes gene_type:complete
MTSTIILTNNEVNKAILKGLIKNGWNGGWKIIKDSIVIDTKRKDTNLKKNMDYFKLQRIVICLGIQLEILASFNKSFLFIDNDAISVIDDDWYIINNYNDKNNTIVILDENNVTITNPVILQNKFMAPELIEFYKKKNKVIPFVTNVSCIYYSIAALIISLSKDGLNKLNESPMYYFLERCLVNDQNNRFFIFV